MMTAATGRDFLLQVSRVLFQVIQTGTRYTGMLSNSPVNENLLVLFQTLLLFRLVRWHIVLQRVLQLRERSDGPVEGWDVDFVNSLGSGGREGTEETTVKAGFEGEDGEVGRSRLLVEHARVWSQRRSGILDPHGLTHFFLGEIDGFASLSRSVRHESSLKSVFYQSAPSSYRPSSGSRLTIRAGSTKGGHKLIKTFRGDFHQARVEQLGPVFRRERAQGWSVHHCSDKLFLFCQMPASTRKQIDSRIERHRAVLGRCSLWR